MTDICYNPYAAKASVYQQRIREAESEIQIHQKNLDWLSSFDAEAVNVRFLVRQRSILNVIKEITKIRSKRAKLLVEIPAFKEKSAWGVNPLYWFSDERQKCQETLESKEKDLKITQRKEARLLVFLKEANADLDRCQAELQKYRAYDSLQAQSTISALGMQVQIWRDELEEILPQKEQLDEELKWPLSEERLFRARINSLEIKIHQADRFDKALSAALTSYDKALIHQECQSALGESSPGKVKRTCQLLLDSAERDHKKIQDRLQRIHDKAVRVIKRVVVDGNNLCYEGNKFIGLAALVASANKLVSNYEVLVIFDSDIRGLLKMKNSEIASQFKEGIKVHVVASKAKADELVLDSAVDDHDYVVSNDRFAEFPEKSAVRACRLLRHEILNGKVRIYDLDVCEEYEVKSV